LSRQIIATIGTFEATRHFSGLCWVVCGRIWADSGEIFQAVLDLYDE